MKFCLSLVLFLPVIFAGISATSQENNEKPFLKVDGEVKQPQKLFQADLDKMKRITVNFKGHDSTAHAYTGVPVSEILNLAGVTTGKQLRGVNMSKYLLVVAADGYKVLFSLAELDSSFTDKQVILADKIDGKSLPSDKAPFQLIAPGEKKPARSCFKVSAFIIRFAQE